MPSLLDQIYTCLIANDRWQLILSGLGNTLLIALCAILICTVIGAVMALCRLSNNKILRGISLVYITAVSYTHLDVYKRQIALLIISLLIIAGAAVMGFRFKQTVEVSQTGQPQAESSVPVSYTHLDVYKRQYQSNPGSLPELPPQYHFSR